MGRKGCSRNTSNVFEKGQAHVWPLFLPRGRERDGNVFERAPFGADSYAHFDQRCAHASQEITVEDIHSLVRGDEAAEEGCAATPPASVPQA